MRQYLGEDKNGKRIYILITLLIGFYLNKVSNEFLFIIPIRKEEVIYLWDNPILFFFYFFLILHLICPSIEEKDAVDKAIDDKLIDLIGKGSTLKDLKDCKDFKKKK